VNTANCQQALIQLGGNTTNILVQNVITIGALEMISSQDDYLFAEIVAMTNLNSVGYPWWSVVNIFSIPDLTVAPDNPNFFGLGDSYAAGIGAHCGDILLDDPSNGE
jgi:hypothetical protein